MLTTTELLPPFAAKGQAELTSQVELPSIYPLKPALNLEETNLYDWDTRYRKNSPFAPFSSLEDEQRFSFRSFHGRLHVRFSAYHHSPSQRA